MKRRAVFLDRDGVLIHDAHYLTDPKRLKMIPGAARAVRRLRAAGFKAIVVSNQSGVGRGLLSLTRLHAIHRRLRRKLKAGGARLDALYFCPHVPEAHCACRKPKTLLIRRAARRFKLDLKVSWLVGDTTTDMRAAENAGMPGLLVRTGKGGRDGRYAVRPHACVKDLAAAAAYILARRP